MRKWIAPVFFPVVAVVLSLATSGVAQASAYEAESHKSATTMVVNASPWPSAFGSLSGIAAKLCGNASAWPQLARASGISNPRLLQVGQRVVVPCARGGSSAPTVNTSASSWVAPLSGALVCSSRWWDWRPGGRHHKGIDLPRRSGTPIRAVHAGTVRLNKWSYLGGWGITIDHGGGYLTAYRHLRYQPNLRVGATVRAGQTIGLVGATGASVHGAHLHLEVHRGLGNEINPTPFLRGHGVRLSC